MREREACERALRSELTLSVARHETERSVLRAEVTRSRQGLEELSQRHREALDDAAAREDQVADLEVMKYLDNSPGAALRVRHNCGSGPM